MSPKGARRFETSAMQAAIVEEIPRLRRYARALLPDRGAADDLVHYSLERACSMMESRAIGESPSRWLFTIMYHLFLDQSRPGKRHAQAVRATSDTDAIAQPSQLDGSALMTMLSALEQIRPERRAALVLVGIEGFSYADAANTLGVTVGTLVSRIAGGREQLRSILSCRGRRTDGPRRDPSSDIPG